MRQPAAAWDPVQRRLLDSPRCRSSPSRPPPCRSSPGRPPPRRSSPGCPPPRRSLPGRPPPRHSSPGHPALTLRSRPARATTVVAAGLALIVAHGEPWPRGPRSATASREASQTFAAVALPAPKLKPAAPRTLTSHWLAPVARPAPPWLARARASAAHRPASPAGVPSAGLAHMPAHHPEAQPAALCVARPAPQWLVLEHTTPQATG